MVNSLPPYDYNCTLDLVITNYAAVCLCRGVMRHARDRAPAELVSQNSFSCGEKPFNLHNSIHREQFSNHINPISYASIVFLHFSVRVPEAVETAGSVLDRAETRGLYS